MSIRNTAAQRFYIATVESYIYQYNNLTDIYFP